MFSTPRRSLLPLLASAFVLVGCDGVTGPEGAVEVRLTQSGTAASPSLLSVALFSGSVAGTSTSAVSLASVSSIDVSVTRVDALPAAAAEGEESAWVSLDLTDKAKTINLRSLPSEGGVTIAAGELEDGQYSNLRLFVSTATITFSEAVTIGSAANPRTLAAGTYDLLIPSAAQTGIKVPASFLVSRTTEGETTTVNVAFDGSASVQSLQSTQRGVQMSPVLISR